MGLHSHQFLLSLIAAFVWRHDNWSNRRFVK
jgi:hypothetical protein